MKRIFVITLAVLSFVHSYALGIYNPRDFGGKGDGKTKDTQAIQSAINEAAKNGGGTVALDSGTWLSGTIWLKDNICLEIKKGATLLGSPDKADYNSDDFCSQQKVLHDEKVSNAHLIIALEVQNVELCGGGTISGNGTAFWNTVPANRTAKPNQRFKLPEWRPSQMLFFCESQNIKMHNLTLIDPPYWTNVFLGCTDVIISDMIIKNDHRGHNNDGIDLDATSNVVISNCIIDTEDDCIAIRCQGELLKKKDSVCENITITNCLLSTQRCNAFRIGVGKGIIRNCTFSNIVVNNTRTGVCLLNTYKKRDGVAIENLKFSNMVINCQNPIAIYTDNTAWGTENGNSYIRGISFSNCSFKGNRTNLIGGDLNINISDITFSDCEFTTEGGDYIVDTQQYTSLTEWGVKAIPYAFVIANAKNVRFNNCQFRWQNITKQWKKAIKTINCPNFKFTSGAPCEVP